MEKLQSGEQVSQDRRKALARLGLGAAAFYFAPTVSRLDQAAAAFPSCGSGPGRRNGQSNGNNGNGNGNGGGCG